MATKWNVDPMHSEIGFKVKHMMITNVSGNFGSFNASAQTMNDDFSDAEFNFSADINSINTGVADRDGHLKSDDFFNAEKFPQLTFRSTEIKKDGSELIISGDLTIRDVTKKVQFSSEFSGIVIDPYGQIKAGFSIEGKIKRSEFGLTWSAVTEAGNIVVGDEVKLHAELQFVKIV
ncbi:MAG: YceI family protein [Cryomorphaceae bacterium]|jgi:polyisoprenoid-binding protein YceI|nr:YceI family protein [Cryomorphaceae bacterium]